MLELCRALRASLPENVALGTDDGGPLWPGEALPGAVPKRLEEFRAGRAAARHGLRLQSQPEAAIPMANNRAPIWPAGAVGSISHCDGACLAAVAKAAEYRGIGLDIEPARRLAPELWETVLGPTERAAAPTQPALWPLAIFVAKEAAYKAQFAVTGQLLDFHDLEITLQDQVFTARSLVATAPFAMGHRLTGRLIFTGGFVAAFVLIPQITG